MFRFINRLFTLNKLPAGKKENSSVDGAQVQESVTLEETKQVESFNAEGAEVFAEGRRAGLPAD
jgi:hypothetical protein